MRALLAQECRALAPELMRAHGRRALMLEVADMPVTTAPLCGGICLRVDNHGDVVGDVRARASELPFADASMDLLVLRHVGECVTAPQAVATEALRVLVAGGIALITGVHPCTVWHPWLRRHAISANQHVRPVSPARWRAWLTGADTEVDRVFRFGPSLPLHADARYQGTGLLAAGYVVVGRKRSQRPSVIRMLRSRRRLAVGGAMPDTARRECA